MVEGLIDKRRNDTMFLFKSNSGSEDVLDHPHDLLRNLGMRTMRIVDLDDKLSLSKTYLLVDRDPSTGVRIISSAHFLMSSATMVAKLRPAEWVGYEAHQFISLADTMRLLKPEALFWMPHDILDPFAREDMPFLSLAECIFVPTPEVGDRARGCCRNIKAVGWPRITSTLAKLVESPTYRSVWFVSYFQTIQERWQPEDFAAVVKPLIQAGIEFKFPAWTTTERNEAAIREEGGSCIDVNKTSLDILAQTEIPILTAGSGLEGEASLLGKPFIRFHFPIHTFARLPGSPLAECGDIESLVSALRDAGSDWTNRANRTNTAISCFDEEAFLAEVLKDVRGEFTQRSKSTSMTTSAR